jgi:hypothetical protein
MESELVPKHLLTFNTVTQHDTPLSFPRFLGNKQLRLLFPQGKMMARRQ